MTIEVYCFETRDGEPASDWTTQDVEAARAYARRYGYRLVARVFEYADSELIEDYTRAEMEEGR